MEQGVGRLGYAARCILTRCTLKRLLSDDATRDVAWISVSYEISSMAIVAFSPQPTGTEACADEVFDYDEVVDYDFPHLSGRWLCIG